MQRLKALLDKHGISQREVASAVGRSDAWMSRVAAGLLDPSLEDIDAILAFLSKRTGRRVTFEQVFAGKAVVA